MSKCELSAAQCRGVDPEALRAVRIWVAERERGEDVVVLVLVLGLVGRRERRYVRMSGGLGFRYRQRFIANSRGANGVNEQHVH